MKRFSCYCILLSLLFFIGFSGCKKSDKFDGTKASLDDFVGTWNGKITTFKNNTSIEHTGALALFYDETGSTLTGVLSMNETNIIKITQFLGGTLYFMLLSNDLSDPLCQNWSLAGFAQLVDQDKMKIYISGNECGLLGDQYVNYEGSMTKSKSYPDSTLIYSFGKANVNWNYRITRVNSETCEMQDGLLGTNDRYVFLYQTSNTCGYTPPPGDLYWYVSPLAFSYLSFNSRDSIIASFPIDARLNSVYNFRHGPDTVSVSMILAKDQITVPAGTYICRKFNMTCKIHSPNIDLKSGLYWVNNQYGIIKFLAQSPSGGTDISIKDLISKNF